MRTRAQTPALLKGLIFGPTGAAMTPAHTRKGGKLYRHYVSTDVLKRDADSCPIRRVPAGEIESAVVDQLRGLLRAPEIVVRTWRAARQAVGDISEAEVREALERLDPLWDELFPAEQARIVQLTSARKARTSGFGLKGSPIWSPICVPCGLTFGGRRNERDKPCRQ
jgi:site-specific DNA recombinase